MADDLEPSLAGQASKLRAILQSALDAIITIDSRGFITTVNPAAEKLFAYEQSEFLGRNVNFLMPEPYHREHDGYINNYLATGRRKIIGIGREVTGRRRDGSTFPMHLAVSEFQIDGERHFTGIIHDLSAHKATERALRQAQKMEAMGQLTGGIAHDFNNLLTVIVGNLEMLEARLTTKDQRELAQEALDAAELGARLTSRLLAFARRSHLEPEVVNLNTFVLGLSEMLHRTLGETISLSTSLAADLWLARVDPSQVESAIVNLAVNARDAMPNGGRLVVETQNARIDEHFAVDLEGLTPGDYVRLSVSDTGIGMPRAVQERAFEPFFTTKETGRGTGLGLSMIYGFAKQSGGHASIYSEEGKGTTVNIYLLRHLTADAASEANPPDAAAVSGDGECILAVEDDDRVRRLTVARLKQLGYRVLEAENGAAALGILASRPDIDLLFTDLVMPGAIGGHQLCQEARRLYPGLKALLTSGYAEELVHSDWLGGENLKVLRKPYRQAELAKAIGEALKGQ
ncbi:PAS domain S-box protein [Rhizobium mongolense]|uniref:Sensor protein FixL n=1 Tax=Rhizobium mongolense TaxID=57676 RepID=A0A7W6RRW5_9HYPH|nr:PAS domain S-box protein [Rhizobium mongolense]MBB4277524.1 PAS domain S-box-containing protein [Rhizobium mongolense]